jgi:exodeoxyribonuclease VII small subunit
MTLKEETAALSFEEAMKQLEAVVAKLDSGDYSLEESITLFQRGVELSRYCSSRLEDIEKRVRILTDNNGRMVESDFTDLPDVAGTQGTLL